MLEMLIRAFIVNIFYIKQENVEDTYYLILFIAPGLCKVLYRDEP